MESGFNCQKCGQCCEGQGGIILSAADLARLAKFLNLNAARVVDEYGERKNGKLRLKTDRDGYCIFFRTGRGCLVHDGKPDICRAWPYFRGNLEDAASFEMAREYCPGISRKIKYAEFVAEGLRYLRAHKLVADSADAANSLMQPGREQG